MKNKKVLKHLSLFSSQKNDTLRYLKPFLKFILKPLFTFASHDYPKKEINKYINKIQETWGEGGG